MLLTALGATLTGASLSSAGQSKQLGPWLMPAGAGIALFLLGSLSLVLREREREPDRVSPKIGAFVILAGALLAYTFVLPYAGFLPATAVLAVVLAAVSTTRPFWVTAAGGVAIVAAVWAAFTMLLNEHLPTGTL